MTRRQKLHPLLWAYRLLANLYFIGAVNLCIAAMIWRNVSEEKVDLAMSWATMAMDQIIIAAGWVLVTIGVKHRREDRAQWNRMERDLANALALLQAQQQSIISLQFRNERLEKAIAKWCAEVSSTNH